MNEGMWAISDTVSVIKDRILNTVYTHSGVNSQYITVNIFIGNRMHCFSQYSAFLMENII